MWQNATVVVVVVIAAVYCVWYVLPKPVRQHLGRVHPALGPGKPCSSCSRCAGCAAGQPVTGQVKLTADQSIITFCPKP